MKLGSICVFCGASPGARSDYLEAAVAVGKCLAHRGVRLVYGGGSVGLMGAVADACLEGGGEVTGVITHKLNDLELGHEGVELEIVRTMHDRKARMADLADGFLTLPGGTGTLEEFFEALTWAQLQIHSKPCALLNVDGYYDHLNAFLRHVVEERFLLPEHGDMLLCAGDVDALVDQMNEYEPVVPDQWLKRKTLGTG